MLSPGAGTRRAFASGIGEFLVSVTTVVTASGEAWALAKFSDRTNAASVSLPPGTRAVAAEPSTWGLYVWLDDGRVGHAPFEPQGAAGGSGAWVELNLPNVAVPGR